MSNIEEHLKQPLAHLILAIADDKLMLGHRNSEWTGLAPILEEDIAFSSLAQDEIAHASALYELVAELLDDKPDRLAFGRKPEEYRCVAIVEVPDEFDWATAIARQFFCDHYDLLRLGRMAQSNWKPLAELAARLQSEERMHTRHVTNWVKWLGNGTAESHEKMQNALDHLAQIATWLFEPFDGLKALIDSGIYPGSDFDMYDEWSATLQQILQEAGLTLTLEIGSPDDKGGRRGVHTQYLSALLDEMCEVYRLEPNAAW